MQIGLRLDGTGHTGCWVIRKYWIEEGGRRLPEAWWGNNLSSWETHP